MVSEPFALTQIRKLAVAYGTQKVSEDELVRLWRHVLEGFSEDVVSEAVSRYVRSDARYFPKPGQIRVIALIVASERFGDSTPSNASAWEQTMEGPCPVCGARLELAADPLAAIAVWDPKKGMLRKREQSDPLPTLRYTVKHDVRLHRGKESPTVGEWNNGRPSWS